MSFTQGQIITATELNNTNNQTFSWSWGHAGWSWVTQKAFWLCTRPSGLPMMTQTNSTSTGNQKKLTLYRYENGAWAQKNYSDTASGVKTISWNSYGIGAYWLNVYHHNNTPSLSVSPCKTDCVRGNYLAMVSTSKMGNLTEAEAKSANFRSHESITATALNAGRVYTI